MKCTCFDCVRGIDRRQQIKNGGVSEEELPHRSRKDTKRWCKGKVGREHELHRVQYPWYAVDECKNCSKQMSYYF